MHNILNCSKKPLTLLMYRRFIQTRTLEEGIYICIYTCRYIDKEDIHIYICIYTHIAADLHRFLPAELGTADIFLPLIVSYFYILDN